MFETGTTITHATAAATREAGLARIGAGDTEVDCSKLTQFDSSALAVLLSWQRAAHARGIKLIVKQLPPKLNSLARAYGIDSLLDSISFAGDLTSSPSAASAPGFTSPAAIATSPERH
jgi:phospholipid transport system transporter-binding protein